MPRVTHIAHEFVENIPDFLKEGVIYISMPFATAIHKCCCGCGIEVVTTFSPTDWKLIFDGNTISLHPSIGNWSFACQSHYWVKQSYIIWADKWSEEQIKASRLYDQAARDRYFETSGTTSASGTSGEHVTPATEKPKIGFWGKWKQWFQWWKR
jgi:hypothetical protein